MRRRWLLAAGGVALAWIGLEAALRLTPIPDGLKSEGPASIEFLDRTGEPLRTLLVDERAFSRHCRLADVSPQLLAATIAAEDKRFFSHGGIDWLALARAGRDAILEGGVKSGASTITQQLVKISAPGEARTMGRKLREMWLAAALERRWSKDQILEAYLNRLDYGNLQIGIASASRFYFDKPASDLSAAEAALLAGLPKAPTRLDPHANFKGARERQHWVLGRMRATGKLDDADFRRASDESLRLASAGREFAAPHFVDLLLQRKGLLPPEGGALVTSLDLALTRRIESVLTDQLAGLANKDATSGAVVVIDNPTGEVIALAGSGDYFLPGVGQVNGAWMPRSPGSTVKAFTYLLALEAGAHPGTVVADVPTEFETPTGLYRPNNYGHRFHGPVSLRFGLGNSLNVAAIRALQLAGGPEVLHRALGRVGITTLGHPAAHYGLGLTLGNGEVRLLELANAFATIARMGVHRPYRLLKAQDVTPGERVFDEHVCWLIADMLADNGARSTAFGHHSWLAFDFPVACKTGTSSDYRDNLTVAFTPEFTVAVWVGNPDGSPMRGITGVTGAAPVMHEVVEYLHATHGTTWFSRPAGIEDFWIEPLTGRRVAEGMSVAFREKCQVEPKDEQGPDRDENGRIVLGAEYADWLEGAQNSLGDLVKPGCHPEALRIVQPRPGAVYFLDPDVPAASQRISLRAESASAVEWASDSLDCRDGRVQLREGMHRLRARDSGSGREAETWIDVRRM